MDDQEMALNEQAEADTASTTPVAEETTVSNDEASHEDADEGSKKGYSARVQELANRAKQAEERAKSLEDRLADFTSQVGNNAGFPAYTSPGQIVRPGEEITAEELDRRLTERETRLLQAQELRLQQERAINRINREAAEVVRNYPQLDPLSDRFDKELSKDVTDAAEEYIKANPGGSVKSFVSKMMKPISKQVTKEVAAETENIARQVSQSAIRPSQARSGDKKFDELSIDEMEAKLGFAQG